MKTCLRCATRVTVATLALLTPAYGQEAQPTLQSLEIPKDATLEGLPTVRVDSTEKATTRQVLDVAEAAKNPLKLRVRDGRFYWASGDNSLLQLNSSGPYTYLSSKPGNYIRLTQLNGKISYVEHVDMKEIGNGSVTWWGELQIVVRP